MSVIPEDIYQPVQQPLGEQAVLILTADKTEDLEFFYPYYRFLEAGYRVDVVTPEGKAFEGKQGIGLKTSKKMTEVSVQDYTLLYIPGGKAPAELKANEDALTLVRDFVNTGKPVASICHGPQVLAAADVIKGRKLAAWPEIENELKDAGASFVNQETITDGQFTTARWPADLPSHLRKVLDILEHSNTGTKAA